MWILPISESVFRTALKDLTVDLRKSCHRVAGNGLPGFPPTRFKGYEGSPGVLF